MNVFERVGVGFKAWYWAWFVEGAAEQIAPVVREMRGPLGLPAPTVEASAPAPVAPPKPAAPKPAPTPKPARSDALMLLEALQREARLIDFLKEEIAGYDDAQIGAAVRDVHRESAKLLERYFALRPVLEQEEGASVSLEGSDAGRMRLVGNVREGVTQGTLAHHGWQVTKLELPTWSGSKDAERIVAPAEVEVG